MLRIVEHRARLAIIALFVAAPGLAGCGGQKQAENAVSSGASASSAVAGPSTKNGVPDADGNVPFEVLRRAVMAANSGDFAGADKYILPNSTMGTNIVGKNVMPEKWPPFTHNGQIASIDFIDDSYLGFDAYVHYRLHYKDGSTFQERASFTKHQERWKLTFMTENTPF